jgi:hypothetical protein
MLTFSGVPQAIQSTSNLRVSSGHVFATDRDNVNYAAMRRQNLEINGVSQRGPPSMSSDTHGTTSDSPTTRFVKSP